MDYYESAEDLTITRERALLELANHHCEDIKLFYQEMGKHKTYSAQAVLTWLGY